MIKKKDEYIFTTGVGNHQMFAAQFIDFEYPNRFITSGSMGVDAKNRFDLPPEIPADWNEYRKLIDGFWDGKKDNSETLKKG